MCRPRETAELAWLPKDPTSCFQTCFWDPLGHTSRLGVQDRLLRPYGVVRGSFPPSTWLTRVLCLLNHKSPPCLPAPLFWTETLVTQVDRSSVSGFHPGVRMGGGSTTLVQLAGAAVDTCLQVLRSVLTVITYGVPNTPEGSTPQGGLQPGPRQASLGQHNQREATGDGEVQTPSRSVRESRPATDCRLSAKTT